MPKPSFYQLAERMVVHRANLSNPKKTPSPLVRLSCTIRWLAGGSYLDISLAHHLSTSTTFYYIDTAIWDLDDMLTLEFPFKNRARLEEISERFTRGGKSPIHGCCGAVDGLAVKIKKPDSKEVENALTFYNRKGFFSINCQAVCDSFYRFKFVSCLAAGSSHDSTAFEISSFARFLRSDLCRHLIHYWLACDDAYAGGLKMVVPWSGRNLSTEKDCFNYWLSSARIFIEQCFGMLVARWGVFWRPLKVPVVKVSTVVLLCCKLHNYIIDSTGSLDIPSPTHLDERNHDEAADHTVHLQDECDVEDRTHRRRRDLERCDVRDIFTNVVKDRNLRRPDTY